MTYRFLKLPIVFALMMNEEVVLIYDEMYLQESEECIDKQGNSIRSKQGNSYRGIVPR